MARFLLLAPLLCCLGLLSACGEPAKESEGPTEPTAQAEPKEFMPPEDWCGTGREARWRPPLEIPFKPPTSKPPIVPYEPPEDEAYPPQNWCGTGRVGTGRPGVGSGEWQEVSKGLWKRTSVERGADGLYRVTTWGEDRNGKFVVWTERKRIGPVRLDVSGFRPTRKGAR